MALLFVVSCQLIFLKTIFKFHEGILVRISLLRSGLYLHLFGGKGACGKSMMDFGHLRKYRLALDVWRKKTYRMNEFREDNSLVSNEKGKFKK